MNAASTIRQPRTGAGLDEIGEADEPRLPSRWFAMLIGGALAAGIGLRVWILSSSLGGLDSDEAVSGLMARHALEGEFSVFYWLSYYGGTQEALLTAGVFALVGSSVLALKLTEVAIFALAGVLLWFVGRRTVGVRAAWIGTALYWTSPAWFVWWTTKSRGFYGAALVCELLVLLLVLRLGERDSRRDVILLGLTLGFGVWASYQFLLLGAPAVAWLVWKRPSILRGAWPAVPAFVLGAAPWLVWNATHGWKAVIPKALAGQDTSYVDRFVDLFRLVLPMWLGVRVPKSLVWPVGPVVGALLVGLALVAFVVLLVRRPPRYELLLVAGAAFPFLYAASSFTYLTFEPRYLVFLAPVTALLLGLLASRAWLAYAVVPLALALSIVGLVELEHAGGVTGTPKDLGPALALLEREGADRVLADYWTAYRISFETAERIVATSTGFVRYQPHDRLVRRSANPARVFELGAPAEAAARARLEADGYRRTVAGDYAVYVHAQSR